MIVQTVNNSDFHSAFHLMGRKDQFSYAARNVLFEYLDEVSEDMNKPIELDVIAICCEYWELDDDELVEQYGSDDNSADDVIKRLRDETTVLDVPGGSYVIAQF